MLPDKRMVILTPNHGIFLHKHLGNGSETPTVDDITDVIEELQKYGVVLLTFGNPLSPSDPKTINISERFIEIAGRYIENP